MSTLEARRLLIAAETLVALTSIVCGIGLAVGVIQFPLDFLAGAPFGDYTIPGILMAVVVGGSALVAAALLLMRREAGIIVSALAGLILLGFEVFEVVSIDRNTGDLFPLVIALQATYTALGLLIFGGAVLLWRRARHRDAVHMRHVGAG